MRAEGMARMQQGLREWEATGSVTYHTYYDVLLADALLAEARLAASPATSSEARECRRVIDQSLALVEQTGERMVAAELYRLRGELAMHTAAAEHTSVNDHWQAAAADLEQALAIAQAQEARSLELRAATSLARRHQMQGRPLGEARRLLAQVVGSLAEGHSLPDFAEARAMLDKE